MVSQADLDLIQNFATELEPFVVTVMDGVNEFRRPLPDTVVIGKAVQSLGMIRGAGSILMVEPLVRITDMLSEAFEILQSNPRPDEDLAADHLQALAGTLPACLAALVDGGPTSDLVEYAHRSLASLMRSLVEGDAKSHDTTRLREVLLHANSFEDDHPAEHGHNGHTDDPEALDDQSEVVASAADVQPEPVDAELREIFMEEAGELVIAFRDTAIELARSPADRDLCDALRRNAHTLKGAANMTGYTLVGQIGAAVENLLDTHLEHDLDLDRDALEMIVVCWKMLPVMLRKIDDLSSFASPVASVARRSEQLIARQLEFVAAEADVAEPAPQSEDLPVETEAPELAEEMPDEPVAEAEPPQIREETPVSSWPAAARLREEAPLEAELPSAEVVPEQELESVEAPVAEDFSRERLGSALLDLAFAPDQAIDANGHQPDSVSEPGHQPDEAEFAREMLFLFAEECSDQLATLGRAAIELEREPGAAAPLRNAMRTLHTLKGGAYAAGIVPVAEACHELETVIAGDDTSGAADAIFTAIDRIEAIMAEAVDDRREDAVGGERQTDARLRVPISRLDDMLNLVGELVVNRAGFEQRLERMSASLAELMLTADRLQRAGVSLERRSVPEMTGRASELPAGANEWDDLEFDRYTEFDRLVRELTEIGADVGASVNELAGLRGDLDTVSSRQRRLTTALQDQLMDVRMVPLSTMAPRFYRVIRQVSAARDKDVRLVVAGGETTFDSTLLDALSESMLHLLRNAVDHGIEPAVERRRAGKPGHGTITVRAFRDGGEAVIEVRDDGGGIDEQRVLERARERGLPIPERATRADILRLVFQPGFTTRDQADEVSGRGVGLDIVERAVSEFKGRVHVESSAGSGTVISLRLPVMLSVSQAFMVQAAGETYAVPIDNIDLVADRRETPLSRIGEGLVLETGDAAIPVVDLGQRLGHAGKAIAERDGWVMVASVAGERWALCVDELDGQQEIVVKPLGRFVRNSPGVVGATILGNGDVALIVDVVRLLQPEMDVEIGSGSGLSGMDVAYEHDDSRPVVLIVDDSLSVRRVVSRTMERSGWVPLLARDGQEALDALESNSIDVIITDIEMPRMDGYELMSLLRGNRSTASIPVIVLTSRSGQKHRERAAELGANAYVVKPFQEQQLLEAVETVSSARLAGAH